MLNMTGPTLSATADVDNSAVTDAPLPVVSEPNWLYQSDTDPMTSKTVEMALTRATKSLSLSSPYSGKNVPTLGLLKNFENKQTVLFSIAKGQLICSDPNCSIQVRFDEEPAEFYEAEKPANHNSTSLFLEPASKMITKMKKSKVMHIQPTIYQEGNPVVTFNVSNLKW